ncbi:MAG: hypothetical protein NW200_02300 [Hyphomonadaceae bacterium]|nr:hypothetical protein [Hyphomonadaceae bacterium]
MSLDAWTIAAHCAFSAGALWMIGARFAPALAAGGDWSRALVVTGVALLVSGHGWRTGDTFSVWFSGFFVCAALHRWIDAVSQNLRDSRG